MSAKYNIVCEQATTFNLQFVIKTDATPWNLTGYSGTMTVRPFAGSTTTTLSATTANDLINFDALNGRVLVSVPAATTGDIAAGRYDYDLVLDSGSETTRILEGKFVVTAAVTI
jgi:hypothetical protein